MRGSAQFAADLSLCGRSECCGPSVLNVCPFAGMAPKSKAAAGDVVTIIEKAPENPNVEIQAEVEAAMQAIMGHHVFANVVNETRWVWAMRMAFRLDPRVLVCCALFAIGGCW